MPAVPIRRGDVVYVDLTGAMLGALMVVAGQPVAYRVWAVGSGLEAAETVSFLLLGKLQPVAERAT